MTAATQSRLRIKLGHATRRAVVCTPSWHDGRTPLPVVLFFHGAGATPLWTLRETALDGAAERDGFLLVLPEGMAADPHRVSTFLDNPLAWNDGSPHWSDHDDLGYAEALLGELPRRFPVDQRRVYASGFSNGAAFTFRLAEQFAERIAAIAPVAGTCWVKEPRPARPVPTLCVAGTADPLLPLAGGLTPTPWGFTVERAPLLATWQRWAAALGCPPETSGEIIGGGVRRFVLGPGAEGVTLTGCLIEGHGHHWPGGRGELAEELGGPNVRTFDANTELWDFFRRHALPG